MKTYIKSVLSISFIFAYFSSVAQFYMTNTGNVGIGTLNPAGTFEVHGNQAKIFLTSQSNGPSIRFCAANPGPEIGGSTGLLTFWYGTYNTLQRYNCTHFDNLNNSNNLVPIENALSLIMRLNGYTSSLTSNIDSLDSDLSSRKSIGLLSRELIEVIPDVVDSNHGDFFINYELVIPFLVEAIKQQQKRIDTLTNKIEVMNHAIDSLGNNLLLFEKEIFNQVDNCCNLKRSEGIQLYQSNNTIANIPRIDDRDDCMLYQNNPNPFSMNTEIKFNITKASNSASLIIFNVQGSIVKTINIPIKGTGSVNIGANEFTPGTYPYSLIVDNKTIDTKILIITK